VSELEELGRQALVPSAATWVVPSRRGVVVMFVKVFRQEILADFRRLEDFFWLRRVPSPGGRRRFGGFSPG
jgi:hypothetical protein